MTAYSFFPSKNLGAWGDGGMMVTSDDAAAERLRRLRLHGGAKQYHHEEVGTNSRLDTLQAAILSEKLSIFTKEMELRQKVADAYNQGLKGKVKTTKVENFNQSAWAQYTIEVNNRDAFAKKMQDKGIPTAVHYPKPLHLQPVYEGQFS